MEDYINRYKHKRSLNPNMRNLYKDITIRNATYDDIPAIKALHNCETDFYFGPNNELEYLIETTFFSKVLLNAFNEIIAFICVESCPLVPALDHSCCDFWLKKHFNLPPFQGIHFIRYLVFGPLINSEMLRTLFYEFFLMFRAISSVILIEPPMNAKQNESFYLYRNIVQYWTPPRFSCIVPPDIPHLKIYMLNVDSFLLNVKCRIATAEDNDIIVSLLDRKYPSLKKNKGEFHVADQILKEDPNKTYILMEKDDEVFGVMLINKIVDIDFLNKNFDLTLCNYLKTVEPNAKQKLLIAKDVILRNTSDFFNTNYFKLKTRLFEKKRISRQTDESEDIDSDDSNVLKGVNNLLISLSFESNDATSDCSTSDSSCASRIIRPFTAIAGGRDLIDDNPNLIFREKEVLIPDGKSDAFLVELFASNIDERRLFQLLKASFSLCNDKDYCITLVTPEHSNQCLLNYFTNTPKRIESECELGLYIAHRNTVLRSLSAIEATIDDLPEIERFLKINDPKRCSESDNIYKTFIDSVTSYRYDYKSIIVRSNGSAIGLVIVQTENRLHKLRKYYNLESLYKYENALNPELHGRIVYLFLLPLFSNVYRVLFRYLCLMTGYKFFYYSIDGIDHGQIYNNVVGKMRRVSPNIVYDIFNENSIEHRTFFENPDAFEVEAPYPLFFQSLKLNNNFIESIDTRIVCIGFDDTCKGFLKKLFFGPQYAHYVFENITVITQPGDFEFQTTKIYDYIYKLLNIRHYNSPEYLQRMGLRIWVNFISGRVAAIDRRLKIVYLREYQKIKYDYLILTCSVHFGFPGGSKWSQVIQPSNYEVVNNAMEASIFAHKLTILKESLRPKDFNIIVYGNALHAYACVNFLLEKGIQGENIHFVIMQNKLYEEFQYTVFSDKCIENLILQEMESRKVKIYKEYRFVSWECEANSRMIKQITFSSRFKIIILKCRLFVCYSTRYLKRTIRAVFQRCGLLIDGRLVIDENFKLNDPHVLAAGPITQYKRMLFANKFDHYNYDPFEVGECLCDKFLENLFHYPQENRIEKIPKFTKPKVQQAFLPGGYLYISIIRSGQILPYEVSKLFQTKLGHNIIWTNMSTDKKEINNQDWTSDFFRLRYYSDGTFRTMICLTRKTDTNLDFLAEFFQHNIKLIDNCYERFHKGFTMDPLKYFTQSWGTVFLYPKFKKCSEENMEIMLNYLLKNPTTEQIIKPYLNKKRKPSLTENERKSIINCLRTENITRKLEFNLIKFINHNYNDLFMYKKCNTDSSYFCKYLQEENINYKNE